MHALCPFSGSLEIAPLKLNDGAMVQCRRPQTAEVSAARCWHTKEKTRTTEGQGKLHLWAIMMEAFWDGNARGA